MNQEEELMMEQAQASIDAQRAQAGNLTSNSLLQAQAGEEQEKGLAEEQLDLSEELERIEHLLRGHIVKRDEQGGTYWDEPEDESLRPLNDYGVRVLMKTISIYLSKRKLLSNYDEDTINQKMEDFSIELADLIFMKYGEMGLDDSEKRKMYSMIVREIQDSVHDVYLRALGGKERDSIRKHWNIQENMGQNGGQQMAGRGNRMNPLAWGRR